MNRNREDKSTILHELNISERRRDRLTTVMTDIIIKSELLGNRVKVYIKIVFLFVPYNSKMRKQVLKESKGRMRRR